jgi:hypothetical protein
MGYGIAILTFSRSRLVSVFGLATCNLDVQVSLDGEVP